MNIEEIKKHLYNDSNDKAVNYIGTIASEEELFVYAYNYNWDNGFDIPSAILNNDNCTQSVALLLFYLADGVQYLETHEENLNLPAWSKFITTLYRRIINNDYVRGNVKFITGLSKVQEFKLKKILDEKEEVFLQLVEGNDCYIDL